MTAPTIRARYDELGRIGRLFAEQAAACGQMMVSIRTAMAALDGGGWIGPGATAFYREMQGEVFPALGRLVQALEQGADATIRISSVIRQSEADAAAVLRVMPGPGASFTDVAKTPSPGGPIPIPYPNLGGLASGGAGLLGAISPAGAAAALEPVVQAAFANGFVTPVGSAIATLDGVIGPAAAVLGSGLLGALEGAAAAGFDALASAAGSAAQALFNTTGPTFEDKVALFLTSMMINEQRQLEAMGAAEQRAAADGHLTVSESLVDSGLSGLSRLAAFAQASLDSNLVAQAANTLRGGADALRRTAERIVDPAARAPILAQIATLDDLGGSESLRLQNAAQRANQAVQAVSNVTRRFDQTARGIIQSIRG